jgi:hypothetical protein
VRRKLRNILFWAIAACCASALVGLRASAWFGSTWAPVATLVIALAFATTLAIPFQRVLRGLDDDLRDLSNGARYPCTRRWTKRPWPSFCSQTPEKSNTRTKRRTLFFDGADVAGTNC